jgi:Zn-dependent protease with chaperone function
VKYWALATVATLSAFAVFALAGSIAARLAPFFIGARVIRTGAESRARLLFALRVLPAICAAIAAFGVALPVYLRFEVPGTDERISLMLTLIAAAGAWLLARGAWRVVRGWRSTAHVLAAWQDRARALDGVATPMPAYVVDDGFPTVAVVGILRPRLFIAECVLRECRAAEVEAMIAHECAHVSARDNLKRLLIRACPDVLGVPRALDRAWSEAAEEAADARAALVNTTVRLNLADALIHVARLAVPRTPPLASAFYLGGSIDARVRRLIDPPVEPVRSRWSGIVWPAVALLVVMAVVTAAPALYATMEVAVRLLP